MPLFEGPELFTGPPLASARLAAFHKVATILRPNLRPVYHNLDHCEFVSCCPQKGCELAEWLRKFFDGRTTQALRDRLPLLRPDRHPLKRGLCSTHFSRFNRKFNKLAVESAEKAQAFEDRCVELGWLDAKKDAGRPKLVDPFEDVVREINAEFENRIQAAIAKENARIASETTKGRSAKPRSDRKAN